VNLQGRAQSCDTSEALAARDQLVHLDQIEQSEAVRFVERLAEVVRVNRREVEERAGARL
jgi:hypothetical protein